MSETFLNLKKTKLKTFATQKTQTEISLLHNPDLTECERMFNIRPGLNDADAQYSQTENDADTSTNDEKISYANVQRFQAKNNTNSPRAGLKRILPLDCGQDGDPEPAGLSLHHSHSDMFIAEAEKHGESSGETYSRYTRVGLRRDLVDYISVNKSCLDCVFLRRRCAGCTLRKLMRQHIIGKLKVDELKTTLIKICAEATAEYKKTMIKALEEFRESVQEKKTRSRRSMATNRIENIIDAVATTRNSLMQYETKSFLKSDAKSMIKSPNDREVPKPVNRWSHFEPGRSGIPRMNSPKILDQISEENMKRMRTQRMSKAQERKGKKQPQTVARRDAFVFKREFQELYTKPKKEQPSGKVSQMEVSPFKVIETASDDVIFKMCEIEEQHEENVRKQITESVQSLQKTKLMPGVFDLVAKDGIERLEQKERDREMAEYIRKILDESIMEKIAKEENARIDVIVDSDSYEQKHEKYMEESFFIEERSAETLYAKIADLKEQSPPKIENDVDDVETKDQTVVKIVEIVKENVENEETQPEIPKENIETEHCGEIEMKPIISGSISMVEYDAVKTDQIWSEIDETVIQITPMQEVKSREDLETLLVKSEDFCEEDKNNDESEDEEEEKEDNLEELFTHNKEECHVDVPENIDDVYDSGIDLKSNPLAKKKLVKNKDAACLMS